MLKTKAPLLTAVLVLLLGSGILLWGILLWQGMPGASPVARSLPTPVQASLPPPGRSAPAPIERQAMAALPASAVTEPDPERELHGTVRDQQGTPIAGAAVLAQRAAADEYGLLDRAYASERRDVAKAATDADGNYRLAVPPGPPHQLTVTATGFAPARRGGVCVGDRVDFVLGAPATLQGVVVRERDRAPVAGARLRGWRRGQLGARFELFAGSTDAEGRFCFAEVEPGACTFDVQPIDAAGPRWQEAALRGGEVTTVEVVVPTGVDARGTVVDDATSLPIAGAAVHEGAIGRVVRTDAAGRFSLPGFYRLANLDVEVEADGYATVEAPVAVRGSEAVLTDIEVRMHHGRRAHGRAFDADGKPLAGVYVAAAASDYDGPQQLQRTDWVACRSDADGRFHFAQLRPELRHTLFLRAEGHATAVYDFPLAEPDQQDVDLGTFFLQPSSSVHGRLIDEQGAPIADYQVKLAGNNRDRCRDRPAGDDHRSIDSYVAEQEAITDSRGRFAFTDVAAGDFQLMAFQLDSHEQKRLPVTVERGQDVRGVELVLFRGVQIAGRVGSSDGGALPTCYLSVDPEDGQGTSADVEVAADCSFCVRGLQRGNYRITAYPYASERDRAAGRSFLPVLAEHVPGGAADVRITLAVAAAVRGLVLDAHGQPVADKAARVLAGGVVVDSGSSGADGRFALRGPAGAPVEVQVYESGETSAGLAGATVLARAVVDAGSNEVTLTLPR